MLATKIEELISKNIEEYNSVICEKYNVSAEDLAALWVEFSGSSKKKAPAKKVAEKESKGDADSKKTKKKVEGGCPYLFVKGDKEGETCGAKPKEGGEYCSRHNKFEGVGQKEKKKIPVPEKQSVTSKSSPKAKPAAVEKPKVVIRLNKSIDKYWNPETSLVFKSKDDRVVIGKCVDDSIQALTDEDTKTCEKFGFKYEKPEEKKKVAESITKSNIKAEHIENVLSEIGLDSDDAEEEEEVDEEIEDDEPLEEED